MLVNVNVTTVSASIESPSPTRVMVAIWPETETEVVPSKLAPSSPIAVADPLFKRKPDGKVSDLTVGR